MDVGLIVALAATGISIWQAREAARSYRSGVLLSLMQQWNDPAFYVSVSYVHALRRRWKEEAARDGGWDVRRFIVDERFRLAKEWVDAHAPARAQAAGAEPQALAAGWEHRRKVSQFISMMGCMLKAGYLDAGDFFAIIPEVKRLLVVLEPIEYWIAEEYKGEPALDPDWDRPFGKVGFDYIHGKYTNWLRGVTSDGKEHLRRLETTRDRPGEYL